ncbi:hypothetical protein [Streptomyces sp. SID13031]|uniref:hypothetical protein n=1 Tax=Streptomyces sp. SID13031 TaxID=2706046 RepID=UPI0031BA9101
MRDYTDIYTLASTQKLNHGSVRAALLATARFRGTALRPLSEAVGDLVELRAGTYRAYRRSLGRDGERLPPKLDEVLAAVIAFADPLVIDDPAAGDWDPDLRSWTSPVRQAHLRN